MDSKDRLSDARLPELMRKARMGWWEADFKNQCYVCSEFIRDLLDLGEDGIVSFKDFHSFIREDYRLRTVNEFVFGKTQNVYDQVYPIEIRGEIIWIRVKLCSKEVDEEGFMRTCGFMECLDIPESMDTSTTAMQRVNNLFVQQNSISRSLLSLLRSDDMSGVVNKILGDIMQYYPEGCTYIIEYDWERGTQTCCYEAGSYKFFKKKDYMENFPMKEIPWWTEQLATKASPIILTSLDELPAEAAAEKKRLMAQGVQSLMVVPMISRNGVSGYAGIDILDKTHVWRNEDYQWFASLVNIVGICMEFRKSEIKAQVEKEYLDNLYRHMPVGYVRMRMEYDEEGHVKDFHFIDSNEMARCLYDLNGKRWLGRLASEVDPLALEHLPIFESVVKGNGPREVNYYRQNIDKYFHSVVYSPARDEVVVMFSDMTDTFKAHEALDQNERVLRNIYKNIPVGIELYDKDGFLADVNDKDLEIFGLDTKEGVLGINLFENPMVPDEVKDKLRRKEDADFSMDYDFSRLKGMYHSSKVGVINLLTRITTLYDAAGNLTNYLLISVDRTETTKAYNQIQEFKDFFSLVGDYAKVGYAHFDALSREGYALDSWYRNVGEEQGTPLPEIIRVHRNFHPEDRAAVLDFWDKVIRGEMSYIRKDVRILREDGHYTWTCVNVLVRDYRPQDGVIEMICINYDITDLKETELKLIKARDRAEEADRLKSAFLANMSHEIRTPLNAIVGFSNLLAYSQDEVEKQQYISIVEENNELLLQLISDILDLSKIEAGTFEMVAADIDVNPLCEDVVAALQMKVPAGVVLRFEPCPENCHIHSDKNRIHQVISNFVNNAFKFTTSGEIVVSCRKQGREVEFAVRDTGIGIEPEKQKNIFDRFVKLNTFVHGTGLGLSICKSIVEQFGGRIGVESEPGKGSRFWFTHAVK